MKTITVNATKLAKIVLENVDKISSTDWDIYIDEEGEFDCRHNTHNSNGWFFFTDLYNFWNDDETLTSSPAELGDWLQSDAIRLDEIEDAINDNLHEFVLNDNGDVENIAQKIELVWDK